MTKSCGRTVSTARSMHALDLSGDIGGRYAGSLNRTRSAQAGCISGSRLTVSVVVCTRSRPNELRECLEHIFSLTPHADEVLVVDNSNGSCEVEQLARLFGARYIVERGSGLSVARNRGMAESRCDIVAYLDDDCIPETDWLEHLLQPFCDKQVAVTAGEIVRFMNRKIPLESLRGEPAAMRYVSRETPRWFEIATFGGIGSGGNMAFRRRACHNRDLFDERLGRGAPLHIAEENCAFAELLAAGHAAVRIPAACVYHPLRQRDAAQETRSAIAYWLLLFSRFPQNRMDMLNFLLRRAFGRPLTWRGRIRTEDGIVSSGWTVKLKGIIGGVALFLHARKFSADSGYRVGKPVLTVVPSSRMQSRSAWMH